MKEDEWRKGMSELCLLFASLHGLVLLFAIVFQVPSWLASASFVGGMAAVAFAIDFRYSKKFAHIPFEVPQE